VIAAPNKGSAPDQSASSVSAAHQEARPAQPSQPAASVPGQPILGAATPGLISSDQIRPVRDPYVNGNDAFRKAITERSCEADKARALSNGLKCE